MTALRQRMLEDLQIRHYSPTTIRIYLHAIAEFAQHFGKPPDQLGVEHIRRYQLFLIKEKKVSRPTCIQVVCALRFFYTHTLTRKIVIERIPFPRRERKLPLILSREEVKALLEAPRSLRHRALLAILYGCGLRVAEVARLKVSDIDSARGVLWVRHGKGCKDRQTLLPAKLLELLRCYWRTQRPTEWLFPGADSTRRLSQSDLPGLQDRRAEGRHCQTRSSAFSPARLCHPFAGSWRHLRSRSCSVTPTWKPPARYLQVADVAVRATPSPLDSLELDFRR